VLAITSSVALWEYCASKPRSRIVFLDPEDTFFDMFRASSFAMSLLLAFRVQRTFERWKEASQGADGMVRLLMPCVVRNQGGVTIHAAFVVVLRAATTCT
jgi:hypothetical protein